jgi:Fe-S-cluster-containing dehydrogenase component
MTNFMSKKSIAYINPELCKMCEKCIAEKSCKTGALFLLDPGDLPLVDQNLCIGCKKCQEACKYGAINLKNIDG